jgi:acyl carrier protein
MDADIHARITDFLAERGHQVDDAADLFETGAIDSMGVVELVGFIEERLGVTLDAAQMTAANFRTVAAIVGLVSSAGR